MDASLTIKLILLFILIILAAFFSATETSLMLINRYRLRHLARKKHGPALLVSKLLERPDRLLGVILIGGTLTNIIASAITTTIAAKYYGNIGVVIVTVLLSLIILIFAEIGPKTLAASKPMPTAFRCARPLKLFYIIFYPLVWLGNHAVNNILKIFKVKIKKHTIEKLTREEISTIVEEAGDQIPDQHQDMLLAILSLEKITIEDVMIPRNEILGINLEESVTDIMELLQTTEHRYLPVYVDDINNIKGMLEVRTALRQLTNNDLNRHDIIKLCEDVYFIPEGAQLANQLLHFRATKQRLGIVVNEYGDVIGLVTLADMLEEIVGEFTTKIAGNYQIAQPQADGSFLVSGSVSLRDLNRLMDWQFDTSGPKTLSGLITEYLEIMPQHALCLRLSGYPIEIMQVKNNTVRLAKIHPKLHIKEE